MGVAQSSPQGAHYHADNIYWVHLTGNVKEIKELVVLPANNTLPNDKDRLLLKHQTSPPFPV